MRENADYEDIAVSIIGPVGWITIRRPERMNSLRMARTDVEILRALAMFADREAVRAIVIRGEGDRAFCSGWDMEDIEDMSLVQLEAVVRRNVTFFKTVWNQKQPVIAAVSGHAAGAGASLAMACDIVICSETAMLSEPEIRHGALSPFLIMPFLTHYRAVLEYYYLGDPLDAKAMLSLGLVNKVVPVSELNDAAQAYGERLALVPPEALQMKKRSLRAACDMVGLTSVVDRHALCDTLMIGADLPDQKRLFAVLEKQGMKAFLQARDGPFKTR
jgi:enoyl-CoA hydratase/carnithine racemase